MAFGAKILTAKQDLRWPVVDVDSQMGRTNPARFGSRVKGHVITFLMMGDSYLEYLDA